MKCDQCGRSHSMAYTCNYCGCNHCSKHRLPEYHNCKGLKAQKSAINRDRKQGGIRPWFKSKSVNSSSFSTSLELWKIKLGLARRSFKGTVTIWILILAVVGSLIIGFSGGGIAGLSERTPEAVTNAGESAAGILEPEEIEEAEVERLVLEKINEERQSEGLISLSMSNALRTEARRHSEDMVTHDKLAHDIGSSTVNRRLTRASCGYGSENVAQSWTNQRIEHPNGEVEYISDNEDLAEALVISWIHSPGHKDNFLSYEWRESGVGISINEDGKVFATQKFCVY